MKYRIITNALMFVVLMSIVAASGVYAQQNQGAEPTKITAKVVDDEGQPLANILVKAFNAGTETFTDSQGNFTLQASANDRLVIDEADYKLKVISFIGGAFSEDIITLETDYLLEGSSKVHLPYRTLRNERSVGAVTSISGEELATYPSPNLLEALAGRLPGVVVSPGSSIPGNESAFVSVRGEGASVYVDGVERNASDLTAQEVDKIQVFKDLSSRAALGISGSGPVIWVVTRKGQPNSSGMNISTNLGINTPTAKPQYLGSYDYARLYNEALENDGNTPIYSQQQLDAYQNNAADPRNPNINYYDEFTKDFSSYRAVNLNFSGVKNDVNYFGLIDYTGSSGFEKVGEQINSDRFKLRGNVNFPINDWIDMNVRVLGSYKDQRFPNVGGGAGIYNMYSEILSTYPSNAHAITFQDSLIVSNDYPANLRNELISSGYGEVTTLNSQNDAEVLVDLGEYTKGLSFKGRASFNIYSFIGIGKGGSEPLYRFLGNDLELVQERQVDVATDLGSEYQLTNTVVSAQLNYDRVFGKHGLALDGVVYRGIQEGQAFQPENRLDFSFRSNYAYDQRYVAQLDLTYSGSARLSKGNRFNLYPTVGVAWIASNESFLQDNSIFDFLKVYASAGTMGINGISLGGYNPFYLNLTTWQTAGSQFFGVEGASNSSPITLIQQAGNENIELPEKDYLNIGVQSRVLDNKLEAGVNYYAERNSGLLSPQQNFTSALLGGPGFLPAVNFEENKEWGIEGMLQYSNKFGDFSYSIGGNAMYQRSQFVTVDEPQALADYRKLAGTDTDLIRGYQSDGLFQNQQEIDNRDVDQTFGDVQPGDIRYVDYNDDGVVDQKDIHATGAHAPRIFYGLNFSVGYKGLNLFVQGSGVADGTTVLSNNRYFQVGGTTQNYSELMLNRWTPENPDNDYPRLTTSSGNNVQGSTYWHENAAYFRISNMQLSYALNGGIVRNSPFNQWKFFVRGKNLFVFSAMDDYNLDPGYMNGGIYNYPLFKTVTAGVSVKL